MRLSVLVFNLLLSFSLLTHSVGSWATASDSKLQKSKHASAKAKTVSSRALKAKPAKHPGDVWARLRAGMQIPRPSPAAIVTDASTPAATPSPQAAVASHTTIIDPALLKSGANLVPVPQKIRLPGTASRPHDNYTPYGRLKLNSAVASRIRLGIALEKQLTVANGSEVTRIRTRIEPLAKAQKPDIQMLAVGTANLAQPDAGENHASAVAAAPKPAELAKQQSQYDRVNKHVQWHVQHHDYLHQVTERARPYLYHIVENLSQYKLPYELALLPIVESAYQPTAQSPKSAAGLWQFIPSTGQEFDLQQNEHYDARLDITASTRAAMRYLSFLKQHFNGDWLLALAAYNCGLGTVDNAIAHNKAEGLDTDYWSLRLPEETLEYVPRFLALASLFADPAAHGLSLTPLRNEPYFVKVKIERQDDIKILAQKDLKDIAQLANLSYEQFNRLNPGYIQAKLSPEGPFNFLLPESNAQYLHQQLTRIAEFMKEPTPAPASNAPLKNAALATPNAQQSALSVLNGLAQPKPPAVVTGYNPFVSLDLAQQPAKTPPINQSALPTAPAATKRSKKNS